jgi:hypothetical protein
MLQAVAGGLMLALILIVFLEICRYFRRINNSFKEISEIKKKVNDIEEMLKNQNN